jgi:hypothetical protein
MREGKDLESTLSEMREGIIGESFNPEKKDLGRNVSRAKMNGQRGRSMFIWL